MPIFTYTSFVPQDDEREQRALIAQQAVQRFQQAQMRAFSANGGALPVNARLASLQAMQFHQRELHHADLYD